MTEPESEAESMSSDDDDGIEFKVYYQDKDCIDIMIPSMKVKCKGCQKKFPFSKDAGVKMSDSPMVKSFYEHCLLQCPPFITSGEMRSCQACKLYFMNEESFNHHKLDCVKYVKKEPVSTGKGKGKNEQAPKAGPASRKRQSMETLQRGSSKQQDDDEEEESDDDEEEENEGDRMAEELLAANFNKLVDEEKEKRAAKKPGPASRTLTATSSALDENDNTANRTGSEKSPSRKRFHENEGDLLARELQSNFNKLVEEEKQKRRSGPASRTVVGQGPSTQNGDDSSSDEDANTPKRSTPSVAAQQHVMAATKLSGKDLSQLTSALKKRNSSNKTPSAIAKRKEEKKRRRTEKIRKKKSISRLSDSSSSGSSSSDDEEETRKKRKRDSDDEEETRKKRKRDSSDDEYKKKEARKEKKLRRKKKPFDPEKAKFRTFDTSSSELDPDEEEFPESIQKLPEVKLDPKEYYNYIPKSSLSCPRFNDSIKCPGCHEPFPCYRSHKDPTGHRRKESEIPAPTYFKHCLRECSKYAKLVLMKGCDECCHRFLDFDSWLQHGKGGKKSQCNHLKESKVVPLKFKWPTVARDTFFKALEIGQKKKNAKMCCPGCGNTYKCYKRAHEYIPDLVMFMHCITDCLEYQKLGLVVKCPHCNCDFMDQKWLDDHECEKAPMAAPKAPPSGGKRVPDSTIQPSRPHTKKSTSTTSSSTSYHNQKGTSKESEERLSSASSSTSASASSSTSASASSSTSASAS